MMNGGLKAIFPAGRWGLAIENTLVLSQQRIEENKKGKLEGKLVLYFEEDKELWEKVMAQEKARRE
jgi:hypothetical protein